MCRYCPVGKGLGLGAVLLAVLALAVLAPLGRAGDPAPMSAKVNVHYCKCEDATFSTPENAKSVHCPCGMNQGKWCSCGHPHKGLFEVSLAGGEGDWKKGARRAFVATVKPHGEGEQKPVEGAKVTAQLLQKGEIWVCPMKCAESEDKEECPMCHMKMKKGEGWKSAGAAVEAAADGAGYKFELEGTFVGKAAVRVDVTAADNLHMTADVETEIKE